MSIYSFQYFLVDLHGITLTQRLDPLQFQHLLVVGHDLTSHIGIVVGILFLLLAINGLDGVIGILGVKGRLLQLEDQTVDGAVISCSNGTFLILRFTAFTSALVLTW